MRLNLDDQVFQYLNSPYTYHQYYLTLCLNDGREQLRTDHKYELIFNSKESCVIEINKNDLDEKWNDYFHKDSILVGFDIGNIKLDDNIVCSNYMQVTSINKKRLI